MRDDGWTAGFLPRSGSVQFQYEKGLFLIYDYPEEQGDRTKLLFEKIAEMRETDAPVRVLFLLRRDFDTWQNEALTLEGLSAGRPSPRPVRSRLRRPSR